MAKDVLNEKTILDQTRTIMKKQNTYNSSYNRILKLYATTLHQFLLLNKQWQDDGYQTYIVTDNGGIKKNPLLDQLNVLRKDVITLSDRLMLNPKTAKEVAKIEEPPKKSVFANLLADDTDD